MVAAADEVGEAPWGEVDTQIWSVWSQGCGEPPGTDEPTRFQGSPQEPVQGEMCDTLSTKVGKKPFGGKQDQNLTRLIFSWYHYISSVITLKYH